LGPRSEADTGSLFPLPVSHLDDLEVLELRELREPPPPVQNRELFSKIKTRNGASLLPEELPDSLVGFSTGFSQAGEGVGQDLARELVGAP
jgi:hypothetical protein